MRFPCTVDLSHVHYPPMWRVALGEPVGGRVAVVVYQRAPWRDTRWRVAAEGTGYLDRGLTAVLWDDIQLPFARYVGRWIMATLRGMERAACGACGTYHLEGDCPACD